MKILLVHPSFHIYGGAERVIVELANYLTDNNHNVTILASGMVPEIRKELKDSRLILCEGFVEIAKWIQVIKNDFDVINFHNAPTQMTAFGLTVPTVWTCNEPPQVYFDQGEIPKTEKDIVNQFIKKVIVADEFNQKRYKEIYGADADIIPYGVDYDFWQKGDGERFRVNSGLTSDDFIITQVGWIHPMKNQEETLKIFKEVKQKIPNAKLVLAGKITEYKHQLDDYIFTNNLQDSVIFTDFIPQTSVCDLYHASNVVLYPIKSQGGWLSVFDAMAAGTPIIVSEEATCSSILKEYNLGFIGNYIDHILEIKEVGFRGFKDGKSFVKDQLSWEIYGDQMLSAFREVTKSKS